MSNPFEPTQPTVEKPKTIQIGNFIFDPEGIAEDENAVEITKKVLDVLSPFMKVPVHIKFKPLDPEEPGFCSIIEPKFRDADYFHNITINSTFADQSQLAATLFHEIGHCFEEDALAIAEKEGLTIFPKQLGEAADEEGYEDYLADLIACHILYPELIEENKEISRIGETEQAINIMFENTDFTAVREEIDQMTEDYRKKLLEKNAPQEPMPTWMKDDHSGRTFLLRVFEKAKDFHKYA